MKRPHVIPPNPYRARKRIRLTTRLGRVARFGRYGKYFPRAAAIGAAGYGLYRAGRFIRRRIQSAKGSNITYRRWVFGSSSSFDNLKRKTLATSTIRFAEPPNTNDALRAAPGMRYKCSGFKMCATFRNVHAKPIHVHMAIVQPKEDNIFVSDIPVNMLSEAVSNTRYIDFIPFAADPTWDRNQDCSNLNPRKFNILTHQKFQLNRQGDGTFADIRTSGSNYLHFEKYFKLNKTFEYETPTAVEVVKPLWVLVWYETLFPENGDLTALEYNVNCIAHVKSVTA